MRPIVEMRADIHQPRASLQVLAILYFGGSRNDGPDITVAEWKQFRQDAIAFDNISMTLVIGDWHGKEELTRKVEIYGDDTTSFRHEIRSIAERYKAAFQQEAVLYSFFETHYTCDVHPMTSQAGLETYRTQNGTSGKAPLTEDRSFGPEVQRLLNETLHECDHGHDNEDYRNAYALATGHDTEDLEDHG